MRKLRAGTLHHPSWGCTRQRQSYFGVTKVFHLTLCFAHLRTKLGGFSVAKVRLLYVVNAASSFFSHRLPWAEDACNRGFEVSIAGPFDSATCSQIEKLGFTSYPFPFVRGIGAPKTQLAGLMAGRRVIETAAPDLVHLVGTQLVATLGPLVPSSIPSVASITGLGHAFLTDGPKGSLMRAITLAGYRATAAKGTRFVFQNQDDLNTVRSFFGMRNFSSELIRGSGVDTERFPFEALPNRGGVPHVVFPARLIREKGVFEFLAAIRILKARQVSGSFELVGDLDPNNPSSLTSVELEHAVAEGLVEWHGRSTDMVKTYRRADIVVLPSYREGLPKALLEAASMGRPMVATDVPGCREVVLPHKTGLLAPLGDVEALASALEMLVGDAEMRNRLGRGARSLIENELSLSCVMDAYHKLYHELL